MNAKLIWSTPEADKLTSFNKQRKSKPELTQKRALELFDYIPETGELIRKVTVGNSKAGTVISTTSTYGYIRVLIDWQRYYVHQVAWMCVHGVWPSNQIDHIDNNRTNNRIENLRVCTASENCLNQRSVRVNNKMGVHGVHKLPSGKYRAQIQINGKKLNLGLFINPDDASNAYAQMKKAINV